MRGTRRNLAVVVVVAGLAGTTVGCGASTSSPAKGARSATTTSSALPPPFRISGRYPAKSLGLNHPGALAIGPDGNLYVTDRSQRVTVIGPTGKVLRRWGTPGRGPGQFRFAPSDPNDPVDVHGEIAVDSHGQVYVSDSANARVQVFTASGRYVRQFGTFGSATGQFLRPFDLVVDHEGTVYVADDDQLTLTAFTPSGKVAWQVGGGRSAPSDLVGHMHVNEIDAHGRLVVANDDTSRIAYLDRRGHEVDGFGQGDDFTDGACDATVDAYGYTYVTGCPGGSVVVFDRTHRVVAQWSSRREALRLSPRFGPAGSAFALGADGSLLKIDITLPRR